jgi:hypothetical protein
VKLEQCTNCSKVTERYPRSGQIFYCRYYKKNIKSIHCERPHDFQRPGCEACGDLMCIKIKTKKGIIYEHCGIEKKVIFKRNKNRCKEI